MLLPLHMNMLLGQAIVRVVTNKRTVYVRGPVRVVYIRKRTPRLETAALDALYGTGRYGISKYNDNTGTALGPYIRTVHPLREDRTVYIHEDYRTH